MFVGYFIYVSLTKSCLIFLKFLCIGDFLIFCIGDFICLFVLVSFNSLKKSMYKR